MIKSGDDRVEAMRTAGEKALRAVERLAEQLGDLQGGTREEGLAAAESIERASSNIVKLLVQEVLPAIGRVRLATEMIEKGAIDALPGIGRRRPVTGVVELAEAEVEPVHWSVAKEAEPMEEPEALPGIGHHGDED